MDDLELWPDPENKKHYDIFVAIKESRNHPVLSISEIAEEIAKSLDWLETESLAQELAKIAAKHHE